MTLKPVADGELPVGAFMGEAPWQSQPVGDTRAQFLSDWIGTGLYLLILTRFLDANRYPPRIECGAGFRWTTLRYRAPLDPKLPLSGTRETSLP